MRSVSLAMPESSFTKMASLASLLFLTWRRLLAHSFAVILLPSMAGLWPSVYAKNDLDFGVALVTPNTVGQLVQINMTVSNSVARNRS